MDVETFCRKYQRKMWKSMISRKKLDLNIWDIIKDKRERVYYMPYSGNYKFEVETRYCRKCGKGLEIGFRKNEFIVTTCNCLCDKKNYATLEKLTTLFSVNEATNVLKIFSEYKTRKFSNKLTYWLDQGYTKTEAEQKVAEIQTKRSNKSLAAQPGAWGYSIRTKEYWLKHKYTEKEAKQKISEIQITNGLDWYINRYGNVEGQERYNQRIKKWLNSYKKALENDHTINERKMVSFCAASKESLKVLLPIYKKYKDKIIIYLGIKGSREYFLQNPRQKATRSLA